MGRVVAIDGPSGAGKSTVARRVAGELGFDYLDTGALYRAVALGLTRRGVRPEDTGQRLGEALQELRVEFKDGRVYLDGEDVSGEIRTPEMGHYSSVFSARKPVREFLLPVQKRAGERGGLVAEGRDMSTVVFPRAWRKFYLDASVEARTRRRYEQLREAGNPVSMERAGEDVIGRDERDSERAHSPLRVAGDAVYIDTSDLGVEEVVARVLEEIARG
jgi:cytidylate kinase